MWKDPERKFLLHVCLLTTAIRNALGKFAEIGQAHYAITAFVVIGENWDPLENYSSGLICVVAGRKNTGKLGVCGRIEEFEDTMPWFRMGLFSITWSFWTAKR